MINVTSKQLVSFFENMPYGQSQEYIDTYCDHRVIENLIQYLSAHIVENEFSMVYSEEVVDKWLDSLDESMSEMISNSCIHRVNFVILVDKLVSPLNNLLN